MAYNKDTDYMKLMQDAAARGDYKAAAQYEQQRNEKIAGLNAAGTNKWNATTTSDYAGWLDDTDYGEIGRQQMALGASADDVLETYNNRYNKANGTIGLQQYANDDIQAEMWDYIMAKQKRDVPTFSYDMGSKPAYESQYKSQIDDLLNQILNREDFSYDHTKDPLYQQYQAQYLREGDRAMRDTLAEAASGAGGMNSYAITAAQQANNYYAAQAADKIPELYQLAYQMYLDDIDLQVQDLGLVQQMDNTQYDRYRDTMSDWYNDRDFAYNQYRDNVGDYQWQQNFDYDVSRDQVNDAWRNQEWAEENERYDTEAAYDRAMNIINAGEMPPADLLAQSGMSEAEARLLVTAVKAAQVQKSSGGGGGSGGSGDGDDDGYVGPTEPDDGPSEETKLRLSMDELGLGPVSAELVNSIRGAGGIIYDEKTKTVRWAKGWNKNNWQTKMQSAGSIPGLGYNPYGLGNQGFVF